MNISSQSRHRVEVVDVLRGFSLLLIILLHALGHFNFNSSTSSINQPDWLNVLDYSIANSFHSTFAGKAYALFAMMFGYSFALKYGENFGQKNYFVFRYLIRFLLLAFFALLLGAFFPGEGLMLFAIVGLVLIFVRHLKKSVLFIIAALFLIEPYEWYKLISFWFDSSYVFPANESVELWKELKQTQLLDSFWEFVKTNTLDGHINSFFLASETGRLEETAGLFVLGLWLGKKSKFYTAPLTTLFWRRFLLKSLLAYFPLSWLVNNFDQLFTNKIYLTALKPTLVHYQDLAFDLTLIAFLVLLYQIPFYKKYLKQFRYCGQMSLTVYSIQCILGSFVFYNWGLGMGIYSQQTIGLVLGILFFYLIHKFSKYWIKKYQRGPIEAIWHKLTWFKLQ